MTCDDKTNEVNDKLQNKTTTDDWWLPAVLYNNPR